MLDINLAETKRKLDSLRDVYKRLQRNPVLMKKDLNLKLNYNEILKDTGRRTLNL